MNIMYLLFSFTTGGTERLVTDICNEMVKRKHNIHLYIVNDHFDESMLQCLDTQVQVFLQKRPVGGGKNLQTLWKIAQYIRNNRIDIVHCNSFAAPELLLLHPLYFPKVKVLHTIHDVGQYRTLGKLKRIYRNLLCHRFIAISKCVERDLLDHGAAKKKVHTVYNAIDLTRFSDQTGIQKHTDAFCIGHVARIMPEKKGQDVLLDAIGLLYKKHPQLRCYFAGDADSAHEQAFSDLKAAVSRLGMEDRVFFLGNVEDVPSLLATLDAFVLPSRYEGFGISLIEAMAMGLPCIASRLDGPAEILQDGKYGLLFSTGDAQDLADKLEQLILHYDHYYALATEAKQYVRTHFYISDMCDRLEALMK